MKTPLYSTRNNFGKKGIKLYLHDAATLNPQHGEKVYFQQTEKNSLSDCLFVTAGSLIEISPPTINF